MADLRPVPGSDVNTWGPKLIALWDVDHNPDGTNKSVGASGGYVFLPTSYSGVGDGVTNDTVAVNNTINAAAAVGGHVHFPWGATGVWAVTSMTLKSNITISMDPGVKLKRLSGTANLVRDAAIVTNVWLDGCTFDNNGATGDTTGTNGNMVVLRNGASKIRVTNCHWINMGDSLGFFCGTGAQYNTDIVFKNNVMEGNSTVWLGAATIPAPGFYIANWYRVTVEGNKFLNTGETAFPVGGTTNTCRGLYIRHNTYLNVDGTNILIRPATNSIIEDIDVSHNVCRDAGLSRGKGLVAVNDAGGTARNITIIGNHVHHWGALTTDLMGSVGGPNITGTIPPDRASAINMGGSPAGTITTDFVIADNTLDARTDTNTIEDRENNGIRCYQCNNFVIANNRITSVGLSGIYIVGTGAAYTCSDGVISNNMIDSALQIQTNDNGSGPLQAGNSAAIDWHTGICIDTGSQEITIIGNRIKNCGNAGTIAQTTDLAGINIMQSSAAPPRKITVTANRVYDDRGTPLQKYGVRLGKTGATAGTVPQDIRVFDNRLDGNVTGEVKVYVASTYVIGGTLLADSLTATTPGTIVRRIPAYDDAGNLLGQIAVYNNIT